MRNTNQLPLLHLHGMAFCCAACRFLWNKSSKEYKYYEDRLNSQLRVTG